MCATTMPPGARIVFEHRIEHGGRLDPASQESLVAAWSSP
jgi:hypothetical protein